MERTPACQYPKLIMLAAITLLSCATAPAQQMASGQTVGLSMAEYQERIHAAWLGQVVGMLVALPFEHRVGSVVRVENITKPLGGVEAVRSFETAPVDDDWYYEMVALWGFETYGIDMTIDELGDHWKRHSAGTWGSSRAARLGLIKGLKGSETGHPRNNPLWWTIGPAFSADLYGLLAPGRPNLAAQLARRLGHINGHAEGVDGAVFVAGLVSLGFVETDTKVIVKKAASLIHTGSPYRQCLDEVITAAERGQPWPEIADSIEDKWGRLYLSTNNAVVNGCLMAIGLWFGNGDFLETVNILSSAVDWEDADCTAASAGAVIGAMKGLAALPRNLIDQFGDRMTGDRLGEVVLTPAVDVRISDLARRTAAVGAKLLESDGMKVSPTSITIQTEEPRTLDLERFAAPDFAAHWNPDWHLDGAGLGIIRQIRSQGTYLHNGALATWPRNIARGVVLRRTVTTGSTPRLNLSVGVLPGHAWLLEIYADNKRLHEQKIAAPSTHDQQPEAKETEKEMLDEPVWQSIEIDLSEFANRPVHLRLYQRLLLEDTVPGSAYWKDIRVAS